MENSKDRFSYSISGFSRYMCACVCVPCPLWIYFIIVYHSGCCLWIASGKIVAATIVTRRSKGMRRYRAASSRRNLSRKSVLKRYSTAEVVHGCTMEFADVREIQRARERASAHTSTILAYLGEDEGIRVASRARIHTCVCVCVHTYTRRRFAAIVFNLTGL